MRNALGHRFRRRLSVPDWLEPKLAQEYADKVIGLQPDDLIGYWPMWEGNGAIAYDLSPQGNDGAYTGVTLGQPGIGDGRICPLFDGANDFNNIYSAALNADFDGAEGSLVVWGRVSGAGVWTDGTLRFLARVNVDGNNGIRISRTVVNNQIDLRYEAGGVVKSLADASITDILFHSWGLTWSAAADEMRAYVDGVQTGATQNGLGVWAGNLSNIRTVIGAGTTAPTNVFDGFEAHPSLWKAPLSPAQMAEVGVL